MRSGISLTKVRPLRTPTHPHHRYQTAHVCISEHFSHVLAIRELESQLPPVGPARCHIRVGRNSSHLGEGHHRQILEDGKGEVASSPVRCWGPVPGCVLFHMFEDKTAHVSHQESHQDGLNSVIGGKNMDCCSTLIDFTYCTVHCTVYCTCVVQYILNPSNYVCSN